MQQIEVFENFQKIFGETSVMETIQTIQTILFFQNGLRYGRFSISFPNISLQLLPNIKQKRIPLNDNIVWSKNSRVIKDLSESGSFFLSNIPRCLGTKKSVKFERFVINPPSAQFSNLPIDKISELANDIISYKENKLRIWCFGAPNMFCNR